MMDLIILPLLLGLLAVWGVAGVVFALGTSQDAARRTAVAFQRIQRIRRVLP